MTSEDSFSASAESALGFADEPVPELRARITRALQYTFSWDKALDAAAASPAYGASDPLLVDVRALRGRVDAMQSALSGLLSLIPQDGAFVGNDQKTAYENASAAFAQLYRDLALSLATLPQRDLLDQLGDLGAAVLDAPVAVAKTLAEKVTASVRDLLGNTAAALWGNLWPYLLVAGAGGLVYVFRAPLVRALGKVSR